MAGITIVWEESGGISVVATAHWVEGTELVKVSVALSDAGLRASPLGGDRRRAERLVQSLLDSDLKQLKEVGATLEELNYKKLPHEWRRYIGPGKLTDLPDSDRRMWRDLVNLHAPPTE